MSRDEDAETRRRILFMIAMLGVMLGVCGYLVLKVFQNQNFVLLVVLPVVFLTAIPMIREIVRLRMAQRSK